MGMAGPAWWVPPPPADPVDRRVEVAASAASAKVAINALNSGAGVWVADLEFPTAPTWANIVASHGNLRVAVSGCPHFRTPRGPHLVERHVRVAGAGAPAAVD